jgi:serine/threonine protein kinase
MGNTSNTINNIVNPNEKENTNNTEKSGTAWRAENLQMVKTLGQGQYAQVLEAKNMKNRVQCAIKIVEYADRNDPLFQYAKSKSTSLIRASKLEHPNILKTFLCEAMDVESNFTLKSRFAIIMELYKENLKQHIAKRRKNNSYFTELELMKMLMQITSALLYLEKEGIYHHSIKEENIFISNDHSKYLIGDMDVCDTSRKTDEKNTLYYAPEMCQKDFTHTNHANRAKSDMFALGIVMIKACKLTEKFNNDDKEFIYTTAQENSKSYHKIGKILVKMVDKSPEKRVGFEEVFKFCQGHFFEITKLYEPSIDYFSLTQRKVKQKIDEGMKCREFEDIPQAMQCFDDAQKLIFDHEGSINFCDRLLNALCEQRKGSTYAQLKDIKNAIEHYNKSLETRRQFLNSYGVWECYFELGTMYFKMEDYQLALIFFMKTQRAIIPPVVSSSNGDKSNNTPATPATSNQDLIRKIRVLDKLTATYEKLHDYENALENAYLCLKLIKESKGKKTEVYSKKLKGISNICKKLGQYDVARELLNYSNKVDTANN